MDPYPPFDLYLQLPDGAGRSNNPDREGDALMRQVPVSLRRYVWHYKHAIAFVLLGIGIALSAAQLRRETEARIAGLHQVNVSAHAETLARISDTTKLLERQQRELTVVQQQARLQARINVAQNQIISDLLALRKNDPDLFAGITIPQPIEAMAGIKQASKTTNRPVVSRPKTKVKPQPRVKSKPKKQPAAPKKVTPSQPTASALTPAVVVPVSTPPSVPVPQNPPGKTPNPILPPISLPPVKVPPIVIPPIQLPPIRLP